jgi:mRNA-capping enzyme
MNIQCQEIPSIEQTTSFIDIVDDFTLNNPLDIVGVHCTLGFNRTGFLIVAYLVEKHNLHLASALEIFARARSPGIYKQEYITELYRRYDDKKYALIAPLLPDWFFNEVVDTVSLPAALRAALKRARDTSGDDNQSGSGKHESKKRRSENIRLGAVFMKGVQGVTLVSEKKKVKALQKIVQDMCEWKKGFPGAKAVSMDRNNIKLLHKKPYKVSWKADGTRYMMLIQQAGDIYFFDRDNSCFQVDGLKFLHPKDLNRHIKNTLLDGEMVIDKFEGKSYPRYLAYDIIRFENEDFTKKSFEDRLNAIKNKIIMPRHEAMRRGIVRKELEPFSVRAKDFWDVTQSASLLSEKFIKQLSHKHDGLIFQPKLEPYVGGRCDDVLKWKPAEQNSSPGPVIKEGLLEFIHKHHFKEDADDWKLEF